MKFGLKDQIIKQINMIFAQTLEIEEALVYGSRAKGNFKPGSDVDIVLKGDKLNLSIVNAVTNKIEDLLLPYTFDISIFHQIQNKDLIDHIHRVGKSLYLRKPLAC